MILQLLPELQEQIIDCCLVRDLANLSCTNSVYREALKPIVNHSVHIQRLEDAFPLTADRKTKRAADERRKNLIFTRKLRISAPEFSAHAFQAIKFNPVALLELELVCKVDDKLFTVICHAFPALKKLTLFNPFLTNGGIEKISLLSSLEEFALHRTFYVDSYSHIFDIKTLRKLYLSRCFISSEFSKVGSGLEALTLVECKQITRTGLESISRDLPLKELQLVRNDVTASGIRHVITFPSLVKLVLTKCENLDDFCFSLICSLPLLRNLTVQGCYAVTNEAYIHLNAVASLRRLDLTSMHINGIGFEHVVGLSHLQELVLNSCSFIGDNGFRKIFQRMKFLRKLSLSNCRVSDAALPSTLGSDDTPKQAQLEELNLNSCEQITGLGICSIATWFPFLKRLSLRDCHRIARPGFYQLQSLRRIEHLDLSHLDEVTDDVIAHIVGLSRVRTLGLQRCCSITDDSLNLLMEHLQLLTELDIRECTSLSSERVRHYQGLPKVIIHW